MSDKNTTPYPEHDVRSQTGAAPKDEESKGYDVVRMIEEAPDDALDRAINKIGGKGYGEMPGGGALYPFKNSVPMPESAMYGEDKEENAADGE